MKETMIPDRCKKCPLVLGYGGEGDGCACSDEATDATIAAIAYWLAAPFRWMRRWVK